MEHAGGGGGGGGGGGVRPSGGSFFKNPIPRNRRGARFFSKKSEGCSIFFKKNRRGARFFLKKLSFFEKTGALL